MKKELKSDKIAIIGAGNVGAMLAERLLERELANIVLLDIEGSHRFFGFQIEGRADHTSWFDLRRAR